MEEISQDDIGAFLLDKFLEAEDARNIKKTVAMDGFYGDTGGNKFRGEFAELFEGDDLVLKIIIEQWKRSKEHVLTSATIE